MFWVVAAAAAQLSAPVPENLGTWFSYNDVPDYLMKAGDGVWRVAIRLNVAPDTSLKSCEVEATSGNRDLDRLTCILAMKRGKFHGARWLDGSPAFGVYRTTVTWAVAMSGIKPPMAINPDLDLTVQGLPAGVKSPALVRVMFLVDAQGRASSCVAEPSPSFEPVSNDATLVRVACEQLMKNYNATPAKGPTGTTIPSVQDALIRFSAP